MGIYDAAELLQSRLEKNDWLTAIAVGSANGRPTIYVYLKRAVTNRDLDKLKRDGWEGHPVLIDRVGTVRPASA